MLVNEMKVAEFGIVKWYKDEAGFRHTAPDDYSLKRGFCKCPNCSTEESDIVDKYDLKYEVVNGTLKSKARLYGWTCGNCLKKLKFGDLNEVTKNFYKNIYKRDLELAANFTVNMIRKEKKKKKITGGIDAGVVGFKGGYEIENPNIIHICGNCKSKDNFSPEDVSKNIFRCQKCGYVNIPR